MGGVGGRGRGVAHVGGGVLACFQPSSDFWVWVCVCVFVCVVRGRGFVHMCVMSVESRVNGCQHSHGRVF